MTNVCVHLPPHAPSEKLFMEMADRLVADGFKDLGYNFVNIDVCSAMLSSLSKDQRSGWGFLLAGLLDGEGKGC